MSLRFSPKKSLVASSMKCVWSNQRSDHLVKVLFQANNRLEKAYFVKSEYKRRLIRFLKTVEKTRNYLIAYAIVLPFLGLLGLIKPTIIPFFYLALAIYLYAIPFIIPNAVKAFGIRNSVILIRMVATGAVLFVLISSL